MKYLYPLLIVCILNIPSISSAEWVALLKNTQEDTIYYDPKMIVQNGKNRHVRIYSNYGVAIADAKNRFFSSMMHVSIDCKMKTFSVLQVVNFEYLNLQGKSQSKTFTYPKISPIPEKSSMSELEKKICDD